MESNGSRYGALHLHILGSGSKGNCALVEGPQGLIMIDDGFSRREVLKRMHELGLSEHDVRALLLTHEHTDHVSGISVWRRAFDIELYASVGTPEARAYLDALPFCEFVPGLRFDVAGVSVQTFPTSHDVVNPVGSGDTMVGAFAVAMARGMAVEDQLAFAMACASANCLTPSTGHFDMAVADELRAGTSVERVA